MKITFLGGADEVGASCTLVEIGDKRLLIDAGIRISPRSNRGIQNDQLPDLQPISAVGGPDYILVTHAHTDHTGALPLVVEQYPQVPVITTRASMDLIRTLQADAQRIMKSRQEQEGELPLFDEIAVNRLLDAFQIVEFNQPIKLGENLQATFYVSGHIAGAGMIVLDSNEGTLVMSGDVSQSPQRTVKSVEVPPISADALVLESTYGGKLHANRVAEEKRLIQNLKRITERGGKVLIPAFALGRAQEVIQIILAFRDEFDVPVYVDGMVRSVCNSYHAFRDILPEKTVQMAGDEHLFFRKKIKPIRSQQHRDEIACSESPCVVVASSGMLTGGAPVMYAKHFAPDERNAILMTGYQDEEAPGRFLQRMMKDRQEGETPTFRFDKTTVKVRCEIDTYSLSAHSDEAELVSLADAFKAQDIFLVHGDPGARHSVATALRQRDKNVRTPKIGQSYALQYKAKPWAIGKIQSGKAQGQVDLGQLWETLKATHAGHFFSIRELAQVWWGDTERVDELKQALQDENQNIYFTADWRNKSTYKVLTDEQVARNLKARRIMLANPDIVGKLIIMRNSNNQPRLGLVIGAEIDRFTAKVLNASGTHYPADAILWVIGDWNGYGDEQEESGLKSQMSQLYKDAKTVQDSILPFSRRQELVTAGKPVQPPALLPDKLDVDTQVALTAVVLALAQDGAILEQEGLIPHRAYEHGPVEQNHAREIAMSLFPPDARLRKAGLDIQRKRLLLSFDFPHTITRRYGDLIEQLIEQTGWEVHIKPTVNQQALGVAVEEVLPDGAQITKGPSYYMNEGEVHVQVEGVEDEQAVEQAYADLTGYRLRILLQGDTNGASSDLPSVSLPSSEQMEINSAYGLIKAKLRNEGLIKTSLKQGQIVLTFISPQVGERHMETIHQLSQQTGYALSIHPHPNQQKILQYADKLVREAGWTLRKSAGIHTDSGEVAIALLDEADEETLSQLDAQLQAETGYRLVVR